MSEQYTYQFGIKAEGRGYDRDGARLERVHETDVLNLMEVFKTRLKVKNGGLALPQEPGLGVVLDDAAVERYSKDGWR